MKRRKAREEEFEERILGIPVLDNFETPDLIKQDKLSNKDICMIQSIHSEFIKSGAISEDDGYDGYNEFEEQSLHELDKMVKEANLAAKYEKDFNPEHYDASLDAALDEFDEDDEILEGLLDGRDDYGEQVFDDNSDRVIQKNKNVPKTVQSGAEVSFTMPNGSTIKGSIVQPMND